VKNPHLTLQFLGEIDNPKEVAENLRKIDHSQFYLEFTGVGAFPNPKKPHVIFVNTNDEPIELAKKVQEATKIPVDKPFKSHITIARCKSHAELPKHKYFKFKVIEFILYKSYLTKKGPIYTKIEKFSLDK